MTTTTIRVSLILALSLGAMPPIYAGSLCQGGNCSSWLDQLEAACSQRGGKMIHNPNGGGYCSTSAAGMPGAGGAANSVVPMVNDFANLIWQMDAQNEAIAKRKREAMMQALESERRDALRRQDAARAANLAAMQQRLMNSGLGLKGASGEGDLGLKLGNSAAETKPSEYGLPGRHIFRNDIFTGQNGTSDPNLEPGSQWSGNRPAPLTLKLGDDATESLRPRENAKPPVIDSRARDADDMMARFQQLPPETQRKLLASAGYLAPPNPQAAPRLGEALKSPEELRTRADDGQASPESIKSSAERMPAGGVALRDLEPMKPNRAPALRNLDTPRTPPASKEAPASPGRVQAPEAADLKLLFNDLKKPSAAKPASDDNLLFGDVAPSPLAMRTPRENADVVIAGLTLMPLSASPNERRALLVDLAPHLIERYATDVRFAAVVDAVIDKRAAEIRASKMEDTAARIALRRALQADLSSLQRVTPP